jgi:hypothetical protein
VTQTHHQTNAPLRGVLVKRLLVAAGGLSALYFAIGSWIYPEWFFALFWRGQFMSISMWKDGFFDLLDHNLGSLALAIVAVFATAVLIRVYSYRVLPTVDRLGGWLVACSFVVILLSALMTYKRGRTGYESWESLVVSVAKLQSLRHSLGENETPVIETPIDFEYLDSVRVEALYNQIEPELEERQRTVARGETSKGELGVQVGPAKGDIDIAKQKESTSTFVHANFTAERKCAELMKFVLEHKTARYYTNGGAWLLRQLMNTIHEESLKREQRPPRVVTDADLEKLALHDPLTNEEQEEVNRWAKESEDELDSELKSLGGLLVVDGEFSINQQTQSGLVFTEEFSQKSRRVLFRITAPITGELSAIASKKKIPLKAFGTVTRPLDADGIIEIRAIAVFH